MKPLNYETALIYLLGIVIKHKFRNEAIMVNYVDLVGIIAVTGASGYKQERILYEELFDNYTFFNGERIGVNF